MSDLEVFGALRQPSAQMQTILSSRLSHVRVVGALALTQQMELTSAPPECESQSIVLAYAALAHLASLLSFALVIIPMVVTTQYNCCTDADTRRKFICNYGFVVPLLFILLILMSLAWLGASLIVLGLQYDALAFGVIVAETGAVASTLLIALPIRIQCWNANSNYGGLVDAVMQIKREEKRVEARSDEEGKTKGSV